MSAGNGLKSIMNMVMMDKTKNIQQSEVDSAKEYFSGPASGLNAEFTSFTHHPLLEKIRATQSVASLFGIEDPYFKCFDNVNGVCASIKGKEYINYSSYNYLGLNKHPEIIKAVCDAVVKYGTSVGASRLVAGERPFHKELEGMLRDIYSAEDSIVFVSGHATNVSTISTLFSKKDLIVYDTLSHNSIIEGIKLSGATFFPYAHNNMSSLTEILKKNRSKYERVLIVTEGLFSMDGDIADLPTLIKIKKDYQCFLMIDEAHSLGVLGKTGKGIAEYYGCNPSDVDIWMGTLSKTLVGCGGYIAAKHEIIDILRYNAPGFVYSVGMSPAESTAAITALKIMQREPERIQKLHNNAILFLGLLKDSGINTGHAAGFAVIPVITGSSRAAVVASAELFKQGISVMPVIHPAVEEHEARLRFFITAEHTEDQIIRTCSVLKKLLKK